MPDTAFNQGYYSRFFKEGRRLGHGARGSVYLCQHIIDNVPLGEYAVKIVPVGDDRTWLLRHLKEVHILERLKHPNIIEYKHTWIEYHRLSKFAPSVPCLFILMEYANGDNLDDFIRLEAFDPADTKMRKATPGFIEEVTVFRIFLQVCKGLHHLHSLGILHRDLKPANLLLNYPRSSSNLPNVLISDFGECAEQEELRETPRSGATGTIEFMAPELFRTDEDGRFLVDHSTSTDIWSLGMILCYMLFRKLPYIDVDDVENLQAEMLEMTQIVLPLNLRVISKPVQELLLKMLSLGARPSLRDIIKQVETILMIKSSPLMEPFAVPTIQALPPTSQKQSIDLSLVADCALWLMIAFICYRCYPRMPNIRILATILTRLLISKFTSRPAVSVAYFILIISFLIVSLNKDYCAI